MDGVDRSVVVGLRGRRRVAWVRRVWADLGTFGTGRPYLNFTGTEGETTSAGVESAFSSNLRRLAEIKAKYDPESFFHLNNNIEPAAQATKRILGNGAR